MAKDFNISRTCGQCVKCDTLLQQEEEFMAVIVESGEQFERQDWCLACWQADDHGGIDNLFGQWRARIPVKQPTKKIFVDDEMLVGFFQRLEGADQPGRVNFRVVLALVLMRKKLLTYDGSATDEAGEETWTMRLKADGQVRQVLNPQLDEHKIAEVSGQLSEILQGEI